MNNYVGSPCPVCSKNFVPQDDIVVCPDCGAPHHRACYEQTNHCALEQNHAKGKNWEPVPKQTPLQTGQSYPGYSEGGQDAGDFCINPQDGTYWHGTNVDAVQCAFCGSYNPKDNIFCCSCGKQLSEANVGGASGYQNAPARPMQPYQNHVDLNTAIYGGAVPQTDIDGITAREYAVFVGNGSNTYVPKFKNIADNRSSGFNIFAFLFTGYYFLYRKMYKVGVVIIALNLILSIPGILHSVEVLPEITKMSIQMSFNDQVLTEYQQEQLDEELEARIQDIDRVKAQRYVQLDGFASVIKLILRALCGLLAYKLYYKHSKDKIAHLKDDFSNDNRPWLEQDRALSSAGGKNTTVVVMTLIIGIVVYFGLITAYLLQLLTPILALM